MHGPLRPDLTKILPVPWVRQLAGNGPAVAKALVIPPGTPAADYLVDVTRHSDAEANEPGFGLVQANAVAARIAARVRSTAAAAVATVHRVDPLRAHLLGA